jgi:hypothetical protein
LVVFFGEMLTKHLSVEHDSTLNRDVRMDTDASGDMSNASWLEVVHPDVMVREKGHQNIAWV